MSLQGGQWVRHPKCPDWGIGQVLGQEGDVVRVIFHEQGEKKIDVRYVSLELVEAPSGPNAHQFRMRVRTPVSFERLETLCSQFHDEMKDNRLNSDDGKMALNVLRNMRATGELTQRTRKQLLAWCHTDGPLYRRGVELAQKICRELYGRIPTRHEVKL
jgi:hypothetical protein